MHFVSLYLQSTAAAAQKESPSSDGREAGEKKGTNLSELLLQAGLARTVPHRAEDEQAEVREKRERREREERERGETWRGLSWLWLCGIASFLAR